jgi:hypothetical protein
VELFFIRLFGIGLIENMVLLVPEPSASKTMGTVVTIMEKIRIETSFTMIAKEQPGCLYTARNVVAKLTVGRHVNIE